MTLTYSISDKCSRQSESPLWFPTHWPTQSPIHRRRRRGQGAVASPQIRAKTIFLGKNRVKFGNFVNFSCIYFRAKMSCPPKVDRAPTLYMLLSFQRLWLEKQRCIVNRLPPHMVAVDDVTSFARCVDSLSIQSFSVL